jgi:hypothetical protein
MVGSFACAYKAMQFWSLCRSSAVDFAQAPVKALERTSCFGENARLAFLRIVLWSSVSVRKWAG